MKKEIQIFEQTLTDLSRAELDSLLDRVPIFRKKSTLVVENVNHVEGNLTQSHSFLSNDFSFKLYR